MPKRMKTDVRMVCGYNDLRAIVAVQNSRGMMAIINEHSAMEISEMLITSVITDIDVLRMTIEDIAIAEIREYEGVKSLDDIGIHLDNNQNVFYSDIAEGEGE